MRNGLSRSAGAMSRCPTHHSTGAAQKAAQAGEFKRYAANPARFEYRRKVKCLTNPEG